MLERQLTQPDICKRLGKSASYVSTRFTGKQAWTVDEAITLLDMIDQTPEAIGEYWQIGKGGRHD